MGAQEKRLCFKGKVSILGVESQLPFSAWLFQQSVKTHWNKQNLIKVGYSFNLFVTSKNEFSNSPIPEFKL